MPKHISLEIRSVFVSKDFSQWLQNGNEKQELKKNITLLNILRVVFNTHLV